MTPSPPKPASKPKPRPKTQMPLPAPKPAPRPKKITPMSTTRREKPVNISKDYKPKEIAGVFDDNCIKYKSEGDEQLSIEKYLKNIIPCQCDMIDKKS